MFIEQAQEPKLPQRSGRHGRVHMTRPRIPPRPMTVEGRGAGASLVETAPTKLVEPSPWSFPLSPHDAAQLPTKPLVQVLETRLCFR
jgi:hypothetical protein